MWDIHAIRLQETNCAFTTKDPLCFVHVSRKKRGTKSLEEKNNTDQAMTLRTSLKKYMMQDREMAPEAEREGASPFNPVPF